MTATLEDLQKFSKDQLEAFTAASTTLSKGLQEIATESSDYTRKSLPAGTAMYERLLGARSVESAIQIQTEFAKQAYEGFVAQATKVSELYTRVASDALKPVTTAYASVQRKLSDPLAAKCREKILRATPAPPAPAFLFGDHRRCSRSF